MRATKYFTCLFPLFPNIVKSQVSPVSIKNYGINILTDIVSDKINIELICSLRKNDNSHENNLDEMKNDYKKNVHDLNDIPVIDIDYPNTKVKGNVLFDKGPCILS